MQHVVVHISCMRSMSSRYADAMRARHIYVYVYTYTCIISSIIGSSMVIIIIIISSST